MPTPPFDFRDFEEGRHLNYWSLEPALAREMQRVYPEDEYEWAEPKLAAFGAVVGETMADNADVIDEHGPELRTFDKHGDLLNEVEYHPAQFENERESFESGMVADAFDPPPDRDEPVGFLHTLAMQTLLSYVDTGLVCSVSMTAGAALVLRNHDEAGYYDDYLRKLTTRDDDEVIQGAMFLTEEQGGSDVGANETVAEPATAGIEGESVSSTAARAAQDGAVPDSRVYELTGEKWFCSNVDAQGTLALGRRPDAPPGTDGLSLFLVPHELPDGELNDQRYRRLKDKLGTESVPTGEVEFDGAVGYLVGEPERGFKYMTTMLNWERVTNATGAVGIIGRALIESKIQAANREAFGETIDSFPLMKRDLVDMSVEFEAALTFAMEAGRYLDRYERDHDDREAFARMRTLVPIAKHRTARMAIDAASYAMEIQGGNGYVREFVTHRLYRDAQVLPIWEGTSNVLSLDLLRALEKADVHEELIPLVDGYLEEVDHPALDDLAGTVRDRFETLQEALLTLATEDDEYAQHEAKALADLIFDVVTAAILLAKAQRQLDSEDDARGAAIAEWFVRETLADRDARGILDGETPPIDYFDAVVRYDRLDPATFEENQ
ncbi:MAG TPA: acyl-CoA dehydrogenase family protein [Natrialbaceae archaeon]|nr:acyl-CoA dehydrogenase family protein [Natrialbaceae archaeon]